MKKILLLPLIFLMCGCWNYKELNNLAMTTGIAIDKIDNDYHVTLLISNSKKQTNDNDKPQASTAAYEGSGKTMYEAISNASDNISKEVYLGHLAILVLSEEIASSDMLNVVDFLFRYPQIRNEFQLILAKNSKASDILKVTTPLESFPSLNVSENLKNTNKRQGIIYTVNFNEFIKTFLESGVEAVLPSVEVIGNTSEGNKNENIEKIEPTTYLRLSPIGIFRGDKFVAWSNKDESYGINILNNKVKNMYLATNWDNGKIVSEVYSLKTKINVIDNNKILINIKATASIEELSCDVNLENIDNIKKIEENNKALISDYITKAITLAKNNKTDIFGFGRSIYKEKPKYFKSIMNEWNEKYFPNLNIEYNIEVKITGKGNINNYIKGE